MTTKTPLNKVTPYAHEILEMVAKAKSNKQKIDILRQNDSLGFRTILQATYHEGITFNLPETDPPYTPCNDFDAPSNILNRTKELVYFVSPRELHKLGQTRVETLFIQLLEGIHPKDAKIVLQMKDKKPFTGLKFAIIQEAYPELVLS